MAASVNIEMKQYVILLLCSKISFFMRRKNEIRGIRTIAPRLGLGFGSKLGVILELGATRQLPLEENCLLPVRVRVWVRVSFGVGGNFPRGQFSFILLEYKVKNSLWTIFVFSQFHEHIFRSSHLQMLFKIGALKDFAVFWIKNRLQQRCFSVNLLIFL